MNTVYMLIMAKFGKTTKVRDKLVKFKEIEDINVLYGQYDIIVKINGRDMKEIENFIMKNIRTMKEIERTETLVVHPTMN